MATTTDASLLHALWLASPALPVGAFSYSEGLEAAVDAGTVHDEASAGRWLLDQLELVQARSELVVVAAARTAALDDDATTLARLNAWVAASRDGAEPLLQTRQMGRSLVAWMRGVDVDPRRIAQADALAPAPTWPVAFGIVVAARGLAPEPALTAAAFGWSENLVQAAVRTVPLGQSAGQRLLARLVGAIPASVRAALAADEPIAFAPMLGIASARHETQYSRLFRS